MSEATACAVHLDDAPVRYNRGMDVRSLTRDHLGAEEGALHSRSGTAVDAGDDAG